MALHKLAIRCRMVRNVAIYLARMRHDRIIVIGAVIPEMAKQRRTLTLCELVGGDAILMHHMARGLHRIVAVLIRQAASRGCD